MEEPEYEGAYAVPARNSDLALYSLIAGISAYVLFPIVGAIAAIIFGHMGLGEINRSGGSVGGRGMAIGGLVLGYLQLVGTVLLVGLGILAFVFLVSAGRVAESDQAPQPMDALEARPVEEAGPAVPVEEELVRTDDEAAKGEGPSDARAGEEDRGSQGEGEGK